MISFLVAITLTSVALAQAPCDAVPLYRKVSKNIINGMLDHMDTTDQNELNDTYTSEGQLVFICSKNAPNTVGLHRGVKNSYHILTNDMNDLTRLGYTFEKTVGYIYIEGNVGSSILYRKTERTGTNHLTTINKDEASDQGYVVAQSLGYSAPNPGTGSPTGSATTTTAATTAATTATTTATSTNCTTTAGATATTTTATSAPVITSYTYSLSSSIVTTTSTDYGSSKPTGNPIYDDGYKAPDAKPIPGKKPCPEGSPSSPDSSPSKDYNSSGGSSSPDSSPSKDYNSSGGSSAPDAAGSKGEEYGSGPILSGAKEASITIGVLVLSGFLAFFC